MFRLLRTPILILAMFVAGIAFERNRLIDACLDAGGSWNKSGFCER